MEGSKKLELKELLSSGEKVMVAVGNEKGVQKSVLSSSDSKEKGATDNNSSKEKSK